MQGIALFNVISEAFRAMLQTQYIRPCCLACGLIDLTLFRYPAVQEKEKKSGFVLASTGYREGTVLHTCDRLVQRCWSGFCWRWTLLWEEQGDSDCTVWSVEGAVAGNASTGKWAAGSSGQTKGRDVLKGS